jgi:hypothetical protein
MAYNLVPERGFSIVCCLGRGGGQVACRGRRCGIPLIVIFVVIENVDDFTVLWDRYIFHEVLNVCIVKIETRLVNQGLRIFFQSEAFVPMVAIVILRGRWVRRQN